MKQALKIILGLALIAAGVLWALIILGVCDIEFSTRGWWTLFIIVPCLFGLVSDKNKVGPGIGLGMGILLLLASRDVITWHMMGQLALALLVIVLGLTLVFCRSCSHRHDACKHTTISRDGKDIRHIESSFGKQELSFAGEKFEGADVESSFGGLTLNLNGAEIVDQAFINLNVGFAGVTIIVPEGQAVLISVSSGFGGVSDKRHTRVDNGHPQLIITGKVGFGGVEIRN